MFLKKANLTAILACLTIMAGCSNSIEKAFDRGETLECRVERGLFFGGDYYVTVNKHNAKPSRQFGAHGQSQKTYKLKNGIEVARAHCRL